MEDRTALKTWSRTNPAGNYDVKNKYHTLVGGGGASFFTILFLLVYRLLGFMNDALMYLGGRFGPGTYQGMINSL
jgi:hypothetical protein